MLKTPVDEWEADFDGIYSGKDIEITPSIKVYDTTNTEVEQRVIRGTKVMFIGDYQKVLEMDQDISIYRDLCNKATIKVTNPSYLDFSAYTNKVLKDPLKNIFDVKSITSDQAKKYMEYAVLYDKDKKFSDLLILKPYFVTFDAGILILSSDFVDFNLEFLVDPEIGVLKINVRCSENTSKYIDQYIEV